MRRFVRFILVLLVVSIGLWIGSQLLDNNQKTYTAPPDYTETIEGFDGISVR